MRHLNILLLLLLLPLLVLQACGGFKRVEKKQQLTTSPNAIELMVDQKTNPYTIPVDYTLNIPKHYVPSCARLIYSPRLSAGTQEYTMTPLVITGKDYARQADRERSLRHTEEEYPDALHFLADGDSLQIHIQETIPFQLWMPKARLTASVALEACNRQNELYEMSIAGNVIYLPHGPGPVKVKYIQKEIAKKEEGFARFYYPVNGYRVDPALQNNQIQLDDMLRLLRKVKSDSLIRLSRIVITGICSPDGPYLYNKNLARERAGFIRQYLINHARINPALVEARYIAEDWEGLRRLVSESTEPGIERALPIIDGSYTDNQREVLLKRLPQYSYMLRNLFPQLRKVVYEIYYTRLEKIEEVVPE